MSIVRAVRFPVLLALLGFAAITAGCSNGSEPTGIGPSFDAGVGFFGPEAGSGNHYGSTASAEAPPPIAGGTLAVDSERGLAIASDPDRDQLYVVDLRAADLSAERPRFVQFAPGDEPGRIALDGAGHAFIALRRGGALVTLDLASASVTERRAVCAVPRGVAVDSGRVYVACAGGELMALPAVGETPLWSTVLETDLRDVVIDGAQLMISTFRAAHVIRVDRATGQRVGDPIVLPGTQVFVRGAQTPFQPEVAWRMVARPGGGAIMAHQRAQASSVTAGGFAGEMLQYGGGGGCEGGVVHAAVTAVGGATVTQTPILAGVVLPVDLAISPDGRRITVVAAANVADGEPKVVSTTMASASSSVGSEDAGVPCTGVPFGADPEGGASVPVAEPVGRVMAVAYDGDRVLVQTREPAALQYLDNGAFVNLSSMADGSQESHFDTGYEIFHDNASPFTSMACASCHPEGGDDGHVWQLAEGPRRTQNFRGGFLSTAPFHWDGAFNDLGHLMSTVFNTRMGGDPLDAAQIGYLERWLNNVPELPLAPVHDAASVERGSQIFHDPVRACATCHAGEQFTSNQTVGIGMPADTTGDHRAEFQVPSLRGLMYRAPYMHNGCAATLRDRFQPACGGSAHGNIDGLTAGDTDDLIAYLNSL